jgi:hypothetical protein
MPRYFFHILHEGVPPIPDDEGGMFEDIEAAKCEALASVRDMVSHAVKWGSNVHGIGIQIADENGSILDTIHAKDALGPLMPPVDFKL